MQIETMREEMRAVLGDRGTAREARRLVYEFGNLVDALERVAECPETPARTAAKARAYLEGLSEKADEYGPLFFQPTYLLNFAGELMARTEFLGKAVVEFLSTGLYFYGLDWIERNERSRAMDFMLSHAECLGEFLGRRSLKEEIRVANEKFDAERPYCLVFRYTNALRKHFWAARRASEDACDSSISLEGLESVKPVEAATSGPTDASVAPTDSAGRVAMMLEIFESCLTETQQRIYLARHPLTGRFTSGAKGVAEGLQQLIAELEGGDKSTWKELGAQFGVTEKTVKREYLRSLLTLLSESSHRVFGDVPPSNFVRRMQETLRSIVQERDLKIRDNAGRGLGKIVERWELSLRYVLNHALSVEAGAGMETRGDREAI